MTRLCCEIHDLDHIQPMPPCILDDICQLCGHHQHQPSLAGTPAVERWEASGISSKMQNEGAFSKPMIISEFGAAPSRQHIQQQKWSENYREKYLEYTLNLFLNDRTSSVPTSGSTVCPHIRSWSWGGPASTKGIVNEYINKTSLLDCPENVYRGPVAGPGIFVPLSHLSF